ncbi:MAG: SDR family oxidoreductase [Spirochaetales bacterium]|nr:SDR family oxidoreductase [Spirochaetales bacterium]
MPLGKYIKQKPFWGTSSIICGGSKGIGKAIAADIVQYGGSVLIIARNKQGVEKALTELKQKRINNKQIIEGQSCDTTSEKAVNRIFSDFIKKYGVPDYLINNVGYSYPQYIEKLKLTDYKRNMETNYYGQVIPTLFLLPHFIRARKGHIINVASMLGYFGIMGYAAYCPSKFAVVGFSEVLRHELKPYNIKVSILYPPDTDTPGYEKENQSKPKECKALSESAGLLAPEQISNALITGILKDKYQILPGQAGFIYKMYRHFPGLVRKIIDGDYKKIRKKMGKSS